MKNTNEIKFTIKSENEYTASDLGSDTPLCIYDNGEKADFGLGDWQYEFTVEVTNKNSETKEFLVIFQPSERVNGISSYTRYEVSISDCDANQAVELVEFCDDDATVINKLHDIAEDCAKQELENLIYQ